MPVWNQEFKGGSGAQRPFQIKVWGRPGAQAKV